MTLHTDGLAALSQKEAGKPQKISLGEYLVSKIGGKLVKEFGSLETGIHLEIRNVQQINSSRGLVKEVFGYCECQGFSGIKIDGLSVTCEDRKQRGLMIASSYDEDIKTGYVSSNSLQGGGVF